MKIAICDDEADCLARVSAIADQYTNQHSDQTLRFDTFSHPDDLLEAAEKIGGYDIYLLDIIMPDRSGIDLGLRLREMGGDSRIIYLTSSPEYALDAFRVKAFDYIVKPIDSPAFFKVMDEAAASIEKKKDRSLLVKTPDRSVKLPFDSILYAEKNLRAIRYTLTGGRTIESVSIRLPFAQAMADLLEDPRFFLCSQSMVVNLDHITEVENSAVVFETACRAFLGEKLCRKLRDTWAEYLFGQED
ncbi:MAG: response regulator transcription factor [Clostridia bacterium]|nr:response regulator transcription factor [Clostridia bacterium]